MAKKSYLVLVMNEYGHFFCGKETGAYNGKIKDRRNTFKVTRWFIKTIGQSNHDNTKPYFIHPV